MTISKLKSIATSYTCGTSIKTSNMECFWAANEFIKYLNVNARVKTVYLKGFISCILLVLILKIPKFHWALSGISMVKIKLNCLHRGTESLEREILCTDYKMDFHITQWDTCYTSFILLCWVRQLQCLQLRTATKSLSWRLTTCRDNMCGDWTISFLRVC